MTENLEVFKDKVIICAECGNDFTFEAGEQQFFKNKGLIEPKRCPACRARRKASISPDRGA